jgi:hypothetical protein
MSVVGRHSARTWGAIALLRVTLARAAKKSILLGVTGDNKGNDPLVGGDALRHRPVVSWFNLAACSLIASFVLLHAQPSALAVEYRFRLEGTITFDGQNYKAIGFQSCTYERNFLFGGSDPHRLDGPILEGYRVITSRDNPSVILADGRGAIVFEHRGSCPSLRKLRDTFVANPASPHIGLARAYYFPDRAQPSVVWVLQAQRSDKQAGRFISQDYSALTDNGAAITPLAQNVPIAWRWYEEFSDRYRVAMKGAVNPLPTQPPEATWRGIFGCVVYEDEWRTRPEFVSAASGVTRTSAVTLNEPGQSWARNCVGMRTRHISLVPSEDYSKATLYLDRADLRWSTINTPYIAGLRNETGRWTPEICIADDECTGFRKNRPVWFYLPTRRVFVLLDEQVFEAFRFSNFAVRKGDGL